MTDLPAMTARFCSGLRSLFGLRIRSRKDECSTAGGSSACVMAMERRHIAASILHLQSIGSNHLCGPKNGLWESDSGSLCRLRQYCPLLPFGERTKMGVVSEYPTDCATIADTIFVRLQRFARNAEQFRVNGLLQFI